MSNSSSFTYGTVSGSSYGMILTPDQGESRPKTPAGLIVTQAVQTKDGWLGQVIVDKEIVWESDPREEGEEAVQAANARVVARLRALLAERKPAKESNSN